jgi:gluconokinase
MIVVVMGVEGSGKTTIGRLLANQLGWEFVDADELHPAANVQKMKRGLPLTDADRMPWLAAIHAKIAEWIAEQRNVVLACSALKESYRKKLWDGPEVKFVYLRGSYELILKRVQGRHGHFAGENILTDQFANLEEPADAVTVEVSGSPEEIVAEIRRRLGLN